MKRSSTPGRHRYFAFYKPYGVVSQFSQKHPGQSTLSAILNVEKDVYPIGRLDKSSEGLLLLTNDPSINSVLLDPQKKHPKTYLVQVEGDMQTNAITLLNTSMELRLKKKTIKTLPAKVRKLASEPVLPERKPPIRYRKNIPTSWLEVIIVEGKRHQVRKMCAATGFPALRLIRKAIEDITIEGMQPGDLREFKAEEFRKLLKLGK